MPESGGGGPRPLAVVAGTLLAVVAVAFGLYQLGGGRPEAVGARPGAAQAAPSLSTAPSAGACGVGSPDGTYSVAVDSNPDPPRPEGSRIGLTVRHGGAPVTGAKVCLAADMPGMPHAGLTTVAKEGPAGRYELDVKFGMGGSWAGSVTVAEPGRPVVSATIAIEVAAIAEN